MAELYVYMEGTIQLHLITQHTVHVHVHLLIHWSQ